MAEKMGKVLQMFKEEPLVETYFPGALSYEQSVVKFLPSDACSSCKNKRVALVKEMSPLWSTRIDVPAAIAFTEERIPCDHLDASVDIARNIADLIATQRVVTVELP